MYQSKDIIKRYIAAKEIIRNLEPQIKLATKDQPPKQMSLGVVGYATKERKKIVPDAKQILLDEYDTNTEDLFQNLDLSVRNIQKLAKLLTKNKSDRDNLIDRLTTSESYASFGVHKDKDK
jgi:putative cell wall-binding protein